MSWGGLAPAGNLCGTPSSAPLGAGSLLLLDGFLLSIERQVRVVTAMP